MRKMKNGQKKIAVAMSGGVDSSVAALLLLEAGYDVVGVNLNLWSCFKEGGNKTCCSPADRIDAARVCEHLKIPFISVDMRDEFKNSVILQFVNDYSKGRTPNPCIRCNTLIKFGSMMKWLEKELGITDLATGHYARILRDDGTHLMRGIDYTKDQSYFLFDIPRSHLCRLTFPLGDYTKKHARELAKRHNIPVAEKPESQEICFVPDGDVASFIEDYYPEHIRGGGAFIDAEGNKLGRHRGTHAYTVGQRRGLGTGFGKRKYVTDVRAESGEVVLGENSDLFKSSCGVLDLRMLEECGKEFEAEVKVRYRSSAVPAVVKRADDLHAEIIFNEPVRAITPGQAAVFYKGDLVLGGGWIT